MWQQSNRKKSLSSLFASKCSPIDHVKTRPTQINQCKRDFSTSVELKCLPIDHVETLIFSFGHVANV
jgi:hypothetical protein